MKALISAYACEPGRGSEPGVGWNVVRELSARHELWVLTRANHAAAILGSGEAWVKPPQVEMRYESRRPSLLEDRPGNTGISD